MGTSSSKSEKKSSRSSSRHRRASWIIGETDDIKKHYEFGRDLGDPGQFGKAVLATHKRTGAKRAVKIIKKSRFQRHQYDLFRDEINVMDTLDHPNIIKGYEVFENPTELYIVMELCMGGELFDRIKKRRVYCEADAAAVLKQLFSAIHHMHSNGIAHCDLKPDNFIFVDEKEDSAVKIIDFGMSKFVKRRQLLHTLCGTTYYIAPEVLKGNYTIHCDMWSLGVVMFIMLLGFPPFHGAPDKKIHNKILKGFQPVVKDHYGPWFPKEKPISASAMDLIGKLLNSDPAERLTSSEALEHPWLNGDADTEPLVSSVIEGLANFTANNKFKIGILGHLAESLDQESLSNLSEEFKKLDTDGNGRLSLAEIQAAVSSDTVSGSVSGLASLLSLADLDKDGELSYHELVMATVQKKLIAKEERLWNEFSRLDANHDDKLSAEEVLQALHNCEEGKSLDVDAVRAMIQEVDKNGDGYVDHNEFLTLFLKNDEIQEAI